MAASIKQILVYLKELKDKYARTEALRGKSFAVAKLIKHLKSKPIQTKDGLPLESITCAADVLRVQGCGPLFARMIEANVLNSAVNSSAAPAASSTGGSSKRSRAPQLSNHPEGVAASASPPKRARSKPSESNTSLLRFAKAGTAGCALLVGMLRLARAAARQAEWEASNEPDLSEFEFCKAEIIQEATPLTETQFGSKAPLSATYASYADGWKSMSSLVNRSLVQHCRGRGVGHTSTYTLTLTGIVAAEEREAVLLSVASGGGGLDEAGSAQAAAPAATLPPAASNAQDSAPAARRGGVIDLALSSDGEDSASAASCASDAPSEVEIVLGIDSDSSHGQPAQAVRRPPKKPSMRPNSVPTHVELESSGFVSSPDDDSDGLGALLGLRRHHGSASASRNGDNGSAAGRVLSAPDPLSAADKRPAAVPVCRGRRAVPVETSQVHLPARPHAEVRKQWATCETLFGKQFRAPSSHGGMGVFPSLDQLPVDSCECAGGQCAWRLPGRQAPQLALVIDAREPASVAGVVTAQCATKGIPCVSFALPVGDFLWAALPGALAQKLSVEPGQCRTVPKQHIGNIKLLGFVVERKRLDDLVNSIVSKVAADGLQRAEKMVVAAGADTSIANTGGSGAIRSRFLMQHWALQRCGLQRVSYVLEGAVGTLRAVGHVPAEKIIKTTIAEGEVAGLAMHSTDSELGTAQLLRAQGEALGAQLSLPKCNERLVSVSDWVQHVGRVVSRQISGQREVFQQQLHQLYRMPATVASAICSCHSTPTALRQKLLALPTHAERVSYLTQDLEIGSADIECTRPSARVADLLCRMYA